MQKAIGRKMSLFGHVTRMELKTVTFGIMEEKNKRGRPHREWADDIEDWGKDTLQKLNHMAQDRDGWRRKNQADTGGLQAQRSWCMMMMMMT